MRLTILFLIIVVSIWLFMLIISTSQRWRNISSSLFQMKDLDITKVNYLIITLPNILFTISVVSQFLNSPCKEYWNTVTHIDQYIKGDLGKDILFKDKGYT